MVAVERGVFPAAPGDPAQILRVPPALQPPKMVFMFK